MGFFDDGDFFGGGIDEIFRRLAGDGYVEYSSTDPEGRKRVYRKRANKSNKFFLDKIIDSRRIYFLFDLSNRKKISTKIEDEFYTDERGKKKYTENSILGVFEGEELIFEFSLGIVNTKGFETKFNNGILEVSFKK